MQHWVFSYVIFWDGSICKLHLMCKLRPGMLGLGNEYRVGMLFVVFAWNFSEADRKTSRPSAMPGIMSTGIQNMGTVQYSEECKSSVSSVFISPGFRGWAVLDEAGQGKRTMEQSKKETAVPRDFCCLKLSFPLWKSTNTLKVSTIWSCR